jgi:hypothetical protein
MFIFICCSFSYKIISSRFKIVLTLPEQHRKVLAYNKKKTKKKPIVPMKIPISTNVGENIVQDDGK